MTPERDGLISRERAERLILDASPAELVRTAAVASGPEHHGRADLDLGAGRIVMGHSEADAPDPPAAGSGRVTLWRVGAGEVDFPKEDLADGESLDADDLELLGAEMYVMENPPASTAEEVLEGAREALDEIYGGGSEEGGRS